MEGLPVCEVADESQCSPYIFSGEIVLALHLLKRHASGKAANDERNRHPGASDDGFALADSGINDNAVVPFHAGNLADGLCVSKRLFTSRARMYPFSQAEAAKATSNFASI